MTALQRFRKNNKHRKPNELQMPAIEEQAATISPAFSMYFQAIIKRMLQIQRKYRAYTPRKSSYPVTGTLFHTEKSPRPNLQPIIAMQNDTAYLLQADDN